MGELWQKLIWYPVLERYISRHYTVYPCLASSETSQPAKNALEPGHAKHTNSQKRKTMSLKVYENLEQGSDEWLQARCGMITASTIGTLITPSTLKVANNQTSRTKLYELAAERISGRVEETPTTWQMERGNEEEERARDLYAEHYAPVDQVGFIVCEVDGVRIGFSPDGLIRDDGIVEFKSRSPKIHLRHVIHNRVPPENLAQVMTGLYVTGREWCDYASFSNGNAFWTKRVYPDQAWFDAIHKALMTAEQQIQQIVDDYSAEVEGLPVAEYIDPFEEVELIL